MPPTFSSVHTSPARAGLCLPPSPARLRCFPRPCTGGCLSWRFTRAGGKEEEAPVGSALDLPQGRPWKHRIPSWAHLLPAWAGSALPRFLLHSRPCPLPSAAHCSLRAGLPRLSPDSSRNGAFWRTFYFDAVSSSWVNCRDSIKSSCLPFILIHGCLHLALFTSLFALMCERAPVRPLYPRVFFRATWV